MTEERMISALAKALARAGRAALAAGSGTAKTPKAVECEAPQSGPKGNAQTLSSHKYSLKEEPNG